MENKKDFFAERLLDYFGNHVLYSLSIIRTNVYEKLIDLMPYVGLSYIVNKSSDDEKTDIVTLDFGKYDNKHIKLDFLFTWTPKNDETNFWKLTNISIYSKV